LLAFFVGHDAQGHILMMWHLSLLLCPLSQS